MGEIVGSELSTTSKAGWLTDQGQEGGSNREIVMVSGGGETDKTWVWWAAGATVGLLERSRVLKELWKLSKRAQIAYASG